MTTPRALIALLACLLLAPIAEARVARMVVVGDSIIASSSATRGTSAVGHHLQRIVRDWLLLDDYRDMIAEVCTERGLLVLAGATAPLRTTDFADGVHPNDVGNRRLAVWIGEGIR